MSDERRDKPDMQQRARDGREDYEAPEIMVVATVAEATLGVFEVPGADMGGFGASSA
jgi:hypothetical protein